MVWPIMGDACRRSIHLKDGVEASQRVAVLGEARRAVHLRLTSNPEMFRARSPIKAVDSAWGTVAGAKNLAGPVC